MSTDLTRLYGHTRTAIIKSLQFKTMSCIRHHSAYRTLCTSVASLAISRCHHLRYDYDIVPHSLHTTFV